MDNEEMVLTVRYKAGQEVKEVPYQKKHMLELDLAYAITIHKSQGSELGTIIIPVVTQHFGMLFRNLIYTDNTRVKQLPVLVGNPPSVSHDSTQTKHGHPANCFSLFTPSRRG